MIKPYSMPLLISIIGVLLLVAFGIATGQTILFAFALATLSAGLGMSSLMVASHTDRRMTAIDVSLARMAAMQEEVKKAQEEQPSSKTPLLATLEGLSQYYLDYLSKQKKDNEE